MKKLVLIIGFIIGCNLAIAQKCNDAALENVPGTWKPGMIGSIGISGTDLVKAKSVTAIADNMIRPNFRIPKGISASYTTAYYGVNDYTGNDLKHYSYTNWFNDFMCHNDQVRMDPDSQIILRINFNDTDITFTREVLPGDWSENEKDHFGWLDNFPDQKNGIIYQKAIPDSAQFTDKPERWLITYDGKLPYKYVTRLEYLQKLKVKLEKAILKGSDDVKQNNPIRPKAQQEKEKEEQLKKIKTEAANGTGDWSIQFLRNYQTDEQILEVNIKGITEMYQIPLNKVNDYLKKPESELQKTAIISSNGEFNGFKNEGEVSAVILIKENQDYYDKKLSKAVPQVIFVSVTCYKRGKGVMYAPIYNTLLKHLDLVKLQGMLGK